MTLEEAAAYSATWAEDWNAHDLERVLAHYTDDVVWSSPGIARFVNDPSGRLQGKDALRDYFAAGLRQLPNLRFTVEDVRVSVEAIVIGYRNERGQAVSGVLPFRDGLVCQGFGAYGPEPV